MTTPYNIDIHTTSFIINVENNEKFDIIATCIG